MIVNTSTMVSLKKLFSLLAVLFFWCGVFAVPKFEDFKPNRPELSLPLLDRKMVIAHNMPYILYHKDENTTYFLMPIKILSKLPRFIKKPPFLPE